MDEKKYGGFIDVSELELKASEQSYGSYAVFAIDTDETTDQKIELIKKGVEYLTDQVLKCDEVKVNFDTITIFVREGWQGTEKSWYEGEEEAENQEPAGEPFYALTVALKCKGVEV